MGEPREAARVQLPTIAGEFDVRAFACGSGYVYLAVRLDDHSVHLVGDAIIVAADIARPAGRCPSRGK